MVLMIDDLPLVTALQAVDQWHETSIKRFANSLVIENIDPTQPRMWVPGLFRSRVRAAPTGRML
jgi:hypothetical protein